jgi:pentatricopeptide repeat protein
VRKHLKADRFQEALLITQKMSKDLDVTVSWNALVEHLGSEDKLDSAMKLYNDVSRLPKPMYTSLL